MFHIERYEYIMRLISEENSSRDFRSRILAHIWIAYDVSVFFEFVSKHKIFHHVAANFYALRFTFVFFFFTSNAFCEASNLVLKTHNKMLLDSMWDITVDYQKHDILKTKPCFVLIIGSTFSKIHRKIHTNT